MKESLFPIWGPMFLRINHLALTACLAFGGGSLKAEPIEGFRKRGIEVQVPARSALHEIMMRSLRAKSTVLMKGVDLNRYWGQDHNRGAMRKVIEKAVQRGVKFYFLIDGTPRATQFELWCELESNAAVRYDVKKYRSGALDDRTPYVVFDGDPLRLGSAPRYESIGVWDDYDFDFKAVWDANDPRRLNKFLR